MSNVTALIGPACHPSNSRRTFLRAAGALAALPIVRYRPTSARNPPAADAELIALCASLAASSARLDRINWDGGAPGVCDAETETWNGIMDAIIDTPARTPAGIQAKAVAARDALRFGMCWGPGVAFTDCAQREDLIGWSLLHDVLGEDPDWYVVG